MHLHTLLPEALPAPSPILASQARRRAETVASNGGRAMRGVKQRVHLWWMALPVVLSACSAVDVRYPDGHSERMSKAEFKAYAERVFRHQNHVVDRLIRVDNAVEEQGVEPDARLLRAEEAMEDACRPLIKLVSAKAEGRKLKLADKLEMPSAAPACEHAVQDIEALLPATPTR